MDKSVHGRCRNMKIDRLIGILSVLLQKENTTVPCLAEQFEVSERTIHRDIEDLCKAGIPIAARQGRNGGISIMEGYSMDRTLLTSQEMQAVLSGLKSLDSVAGTNRYQLLMEKLSVGSSGVNAGNHMVIDLSSWYRESLAPKIELIQQAINCKKKIAFHYFAAGGECERKIEPYLLVFQWSAWYVWGYCEKREAYRLFKLNRTDQIKLLEEDCGSREVPEYKIEPAKPFPPLIQVKAVFEPEVKWRLVEEYGPESFLTREDGKLLFQGGFPEKQKLFRWLLTFQDMVELLEPEELRTEISQIGENIQKKYRKHDI